MAFFFSPGGDNVLQIFLFWFFRAANFLAAAMGVVSAVLILGTFQLLIVAAVNAAFDVWSRRAGNRLKKRGKKPRNRLEKVLMENADD